MSVRDRQRGSLSNKIKEGKWQNWVYPIILSHSGPRKNYNTTHNYIRILMSRALCLGRLWLKSSVDPTRVERKSRLSVTRQKHPVCWVVRRIIVQESGGWFMGICMISETWWLLSMTFTPHRFLVGSRRPPLSHYYHYAWASSLRCYTQTTEQATNRGSSQPLYMVLVHPKAPHEIDRDTFQLCGVSDFPSLT